MAVKVTEMTKTDCFAFGERRCKILKERYCDREKCNFYRQETDAEKEEKSKAEHKKRR